MHDVKNLTHPDCCDEMRLHQSVRLLISDGFYDGDNDTPPKWYVKGYIPFDKVLEWHDKTEEVKPAEPDCPLTEVNVEAKFCPYCAAPVPEIERIKVEKPVCKCTDGGYYCDACGKRLNECQCLPPMNEWRPKRA